MALRTAPLLRLTDGKWALHPDGAALLGSVTTPVCVVCVAGRYRTGKSFFLNSLAGNTGAKKEAGFKVGSTSESCTRGIDVCLPEPSTAALACGGTLVLLDTEGLASMDQDETYDAQVFALGLLLSSHFVLNQMGVIDEAAIDQLYLVAELSKHVCVTAAPEGSGGGSGGGDAATGGAAAGEAHSNQQLAQFFPPLLWLLRDFVVGPPRCRSNRHPAAARPHIYVLEICVCVLGCGGGLCGAARPSLSRLPAAPSPLAPRPPQT